MLFEELLVREIPLLFLGDPKTGGVPLRSWPGGFQGLAVYIDNVSVLETAGDLGLAMGSFGVGEMKPATLFSWAAEEGWGIAICVFKDKGKPLYVPIDAEEVRALAAPASTL